MKSSAPTARPAALDLLAASRPARPKAMLSPIVPLNRKPSCGTIPICERSDALRDVAQVVAVDEHAAARSGRRSARRAWRTSTCRRRSRRRARRSGRAARAGRRRCSASLRRRPRSSRRTSRRSKRDLAAQRRAARSRRAVDEVGLARRAARRSCRAPPCPTGRSCRAARAARSGRRSCSARRRSRRARRSSTSPSIDLVAAVEQDPDRRERADELDRREVGGVEVDRRHVRVAVALVELAEARRGGAAPGRTSARRGCPTATPAGRR